jgi:predicted nuclease of predicted toxin-antitoxin system
VFAVCRCQGTEHQNSSSGMIKLLIDENISYRLVKKVEDIFPDSQQVKRLGLLGKEDYIIWNYAKKNDFVILTQDDDYIELSQLLGYPPKVILLRTGSISTEELAGLLKQKIRDIEFFISPEQDFGCIEFYSPQSEIKKLI